MPRLRRTFRSQRDKLTAALSFLKSFRRTNWTLEDYPIKVFKLTPQALEPIGRWKPSPWTAQIINWWFMRGNGETREEAISQLRQRFENFKVRAKKLPRPGTRVRPKIELAPREKIQTYGVLTEELMERIVGFEPGSYLITDESTLWDFHSEETNEPYFRKIMLLYGIDASDIEPPTISEIARRIHESRRTR